MNGEVLNAEIISIISMGASIVALMLALYRGLRADMAQQRNAISELGTQIRQEMNGLRQELKQDISKLEQRINDLRQKLEQDISELRQKLEQDVNESRQELEQRISELRQELEQRISELRREAKQDRQDITRDLKVLGERTARIQGAVTGLWDNEMMGEVEAVSSPVASPRPEAEA